MTLSGPHSHCVIVVSFPPVCQVIWGRAVGDQHTGRAAVPGSVQRTGPQVRHGRRLLGPAGQLRRQTVSTREEPFKKNEKNKLDGNIYCSAAWVK